MTSKRSAAVHNVNAPKSVKILCADNRRHMKIMAQANHDYDMFRRSGFKGTWWNKRELAASRKEEADAKALLLNGPKVVL